MKKEKKQRPRMTLEKQWRLRIRQACDGNFLRRAELVVCRSRGSQGTRVTMAVEFTSLRSTSHLDSKISEGKSPRLGTHQGWFMDYHGMLGGSGEETLKVVLACVTTVFKVSHREVPLAMTIDQPQQQARISTLLLEYSRSREGFWDHSAGSMSVCWPEASWGTQSHDIRTSSTESSH